jgi:hypothetical protein
MPRQRRTRRVSRDKMHNEDQAARPLPRQGSVTIFCQEHTMVRMDAHPV